MHITQPTPASHVDDPLAQLEKEFKHWRDNKKSTREHIPSALLEAARELSEHYGSTEVRRRLGISNAQLKRLQTAGQTQPVDFMDASKLATASQDNRTSALRVEIHTPEGATITLSGLPDTQPLTMIAKLIGDSV